MTTTPTKRPESAGIAWAPVLWIAGLHAGALLAFVPAYFTWQALAVCLVLHWLTGGLGICMTYHRLLTHRSFATRPRWLEYVLTAIGCCASEGGPIGWVADHRKHHAHADDEHDVHSPEPRLRLGPHALVDDPRRHLGHTPEYYERWAPDLYRDPVHRWLDRYPLRLPDPDVRGASMPSAGCPGWSGAASSGRSSVLHTTWLVNSATHVWGYRTPRDPRHLDEPLVGRAC